MTTYRDLLNPNILNDYHYEGFMGDSEFVSENGELKMGSWNFETSFDAWLRDEEYPTLDTEIDEKEILNGETYIEIFNDNNELCGVIFNY